MSSRGRFLGSLTPLSAQAHRPAGSQGRISLSSPGAIRRARSNGESLAALMCKILEPIPNLANRSIMIWQL
jgi:hypothetical protein